MEYAKEMEHPMQNTCVAFGSFDGVHAGHREILAKLLEQKGLTPVVVSFATEGKKELYTEEEKRWLLNKAGVSTMISLPAAETEAMEPEAFVKEVLVGKLGAKKIVVGEGFAFGKDGKGDAALLGVLSGKYGYELILCPQVKIDGETVTADAIIKAFEAGDFDKAEKLLGHTFIVIGKVLHGKGHGRQSAMPTANIGFGDTKQLPPYGVYATLNLIDGEKIKGMTNIGLRPSDDSLPHPTIETFLLNFHRDIYDKEVVMECHQYIRPTIKFKNLDEVKKQIDHDISQIQDYLEKLGGEGSGNYRDAAYLLEGGEEGVLLIHGFCGSPRLYMHLSQILSKKGYTIYAPLLAGHGTKPEDIADCTAQDWINDVDKAYDEIKKYCKKVHIVGLSMGGGLGTYLAGRHGGDPSVLSVTLMVPGYALRNKDFYKMDFSDKYKMMGMVSRDAYGDERDDIKCGYTCMPMGGIKNLIDLMKLQEGWELKITAPTQVLYSAADPVCDPAVIDEVAKRIQSLESEHCYPESEHNLLMGDDHDDVNKRVLDFISKHSSIK